MSKEFALEILTPGRAVVRASVSEVLLPAYDGEKGILAEHEDFVGILGTGPVKIVREGDDYWFMVSSGVYEVRDGNVTLFAELGEDAESVDIENAKQKLEEVDAIFADHKNYDPEQYPALKLSRERNAARVEIHRRTELVN